MSIFRQLIRRLTGLLIDRAWLVTAILLLASYFAGYFFMLQGNESAIVDAYFWWFMVSSTTVGYGDLYPTSVAGRFGAVIVMLIGIGVMAIIIGKVAESVLEITNRRQKGRGKMREENHTLIIGYRKGSTEKIIEELLSDDKQARIVLCSEKLEENPFHSSKVGFVRGETASPEVLERCSAARAKNAIIYGRDDNQTFFTAYAFREINTSAHMVCFLANENHAKKIYTLPAASRSLNQVILPVNVYLMAQELQNPESSNVIQHLVSNLNGATVFRVDIDSPTKKKLTYGAVFLGLKDKYQATAIAVKKDEVISNPDSALELDPGDGIFYIADKRLGQVAWEQL